MLLAMDTATRALSVALHDGDTLIAELTVPTDGRHTTELLPLVQQAMQVSGITMRDLRQIAIAAGPGSFNGLRVGFSTAKGLAQACSLLLMSVPTLDITAYGVSIDSEALIAVAQAGRGRVIAARYTLQAGVWMISSDTQIISWPDLLTTMINPGESTQIAGEIDADGRAHILQATATNAALRITPASHSLRRAGNLAALAWMQWNNTAESERAATFGLARALPIYLHQAGVPHP